MVENMYHERDDEDKDSKGSGAVNVGTRQRTYAQFCPIAVGLDLLGDRWVLLICRELSMGDRRFTDLRAALTGIAPNLLSDRLRALTASGLVTCAELPPPAARSVYRLTEAGREVVPVLRTLARFGVQFLDADGAGAATVDARRSAHAFLLPWLRRPAGPLRLHLVFGEDDSTEIDVSDGEVRVVRPQPDPDLTVATTCAALVEARQVGAALVARVIGPPSARKAFSDAFQLELA